jgi:hypothetical protein
VAKARPRRQLRKRRRQRQQRSMSYRASSNFGNMAGCRITPVLVFWTGRALYWVKFTFETGFKLPSSCITLPCYALNLNRNILDFMRWPHIGLGAQDLNDIQRPKYFQNIAGSEVLDKYYNSHLRK